MSSRPHAEAGTNLKVYAVKSEWKALIDKVGTKSADLKDKFFVLEFCGFPNRLDEVKGRKLPYAASQSRFQNFPHTEKKVKT